MVDACEMLKPDCYFVMMGTPCVFSGDDKTPKDEYYLYDPDNYYGWCKAVQETVVRRSRPRWLITRGNFVPYEKWPYPEAFTDRKSNYLFAHQLARGIKEVIDSEKGGIVHVLGDKIISMYELAKRCSDSEGVRPTTLKEFYRKNRDFPCRLTKNMVMKSTFWKTYNIDEV